MQNRLNKKILLITFLILSVVLVLSGCNVSKEEGVATVNGKIISKSDFDLNFDINKRIYESQLGSDVMSRDMGNGKTFEEELKNIVLENIIIEEVILQAAEKEKIKLTKDELDEAINEFTESVGGKEKLKEILQQNHMTDEYIRSRMEKDMVIGKYRDKFYESIISEEDAKNLYEKNKDLYISVKASHILVNTEEEAKDILKKINAGENFDDLTKLSIEPGAEERKGDLGYFTKDRMVPEFSEAAFELKPGEISDVVKTDFGYHIIKLVDRKESFEEVKDDIIAVLQNQQSEKFEEKIKELRDTAKVEYLIKEEKVENKDTDEANKEENKEENKDNN
ncbi:foldase protein PrsA [Proteiniborus ethanoligenes]|uniref:Foldase protein PrsA n=1 Tax=Proteiniborus ethanoligenes TaxID=415015 RepID=A0A1H3KY24_9FIRM|nr:peptidylprolyl isomerase [Proteiniborus ethanoligenes]SDY57137.1 foldase protein PrsA [Proteiniborus ethanoligenes]